MVSLQALHEAWAAHPLGRDRARGGRIALSGFLFQLYLSLDRFFDRVLEGNPGAQFLFDGLSDLAELKGDIVYLTQIKTTLDARSLRSAVEESLAVWQFLSEQHPNLRERARFQVAARRARSSAWLDVGAVSAEELRLDGDQSRLWAAVREKFLPVQIRGSPKVDLAIRLWPHAQECFALVDSCLGRLFALLGEDRSSTEIAESLLEIWDRARTHQQPPGRLLGPRELASVQASTERIVHGVRPRPQDLCEGCFMERPGLLETALHAIHETSLKLERSPGPQPVPIFWISGPSGAGKSVALLQVMRELVIQGEVDAANYLGEFAHRLPRSLAYWSCASERALIAVDDVFAPQNRDRELWQDVAELAFTTTWRRLPLILTCGPAEQLRAFKDEARRHPELQPVEIRIEPMSSEEQAAYHSWYEQRTGAKVRVTREPIFVAAAWIYELHRQAELSPEAFAARFYSRLGELGLQVAAMAAMALNQYGMKPAEGLFAGREAELDQLTSEQIYRLAHPGAGLRQGCFFHPRIAKIIYDAIVPESDARRRAEDLARCFRVMLDDARASNDFLSWLNAPKTQSLVTPSLKREILVALWPVFRERGPVADALPQLKYWHEMACAVGVSVSGIGASRQILDWFNAASEDAPDWGFLFQIVWDTEGVERDGLYARGEAWLGRNFGSGSWNWIWQRLWAYRPKKQELVDLGFLWLYDNPAHPGWSRVWQCIFDQGLRQPDLLRSAIEALPLQPESSADLPIWQKVESLEPSKTDFVSAIWHKLARVRSSYKMEQGVDFILHRTDASSLSEVLSDAIADTMGEPSWPHLWQVLVRKCGAERYLLELGRDWLAGREERPEWAFVWQRLVELGFETDTLLRIGRDWLAGREERPEYPYVYHKIHGGWPRR